MNMQLDSKVGVSMLATVRAQAEQSDDSFATTKAGLRQLSARDIRYTSLTVFSNVDASAAGIASPADS